MLITGEVEGQVGMVERVYGNSVISSRFFCKHKALLKNKGHYVTNKKQQKRKATVLVVLTHGNVRDCPSY